MAVRHRGGVRVVDVALVNAQPEPAELVDNARLYQVVRTVTAVDGASAVFLGHNDPDLGPRPSSTDPERLHLDLLYRRQREHAHGRQCAVDADVRPGERRAWRLATTSFPAADVALVVPAAAADMPGLELDMARLGDPDLAGQDLVRALRPLVVGYRAWLGAEAARAQADPEIGRYGRAASEMIAEAAGLVDRLDQAIVVLSDDALARDAFRFANQAMALQRVHTEVVRARLADPTRTVADLLGELDVPARRSWRPFQLAFVLLCLPGLTDPGHPDAHRGVSDGQVQLLFFPTGGARPRATWA
ncbi:MAG: hypothetical protein ACYC1D_11550 [Acidimicrobiales bacterium]